MKRVLPVLILALSVASTASAAPISYFAFLSGPNEAPPVASPGTGTTVVTIDDAAHTLRVLVSFKDLVAGTTASHLHAPTAVPFAGTVGVATTTPTFAGFPLGVTAGYYDVTLNTLLASTYNPAFLNNATNLGSTATAEQSLFGAIAGGRSYLNIHTTFAPGGEIRGFLAPCGVPGTPACPSVPEPASLTLAGLALAGLVMRRRSR